MSEQLALVDAPTPEDIMATALREFGPFCTRVCLLSGGQPGNCQCPKTAAPVTPEAERWEGWGTALKPAHEPIVLARKPLIGTVAANVLAHSTGALHVDACRIGTDAGWSYPNGAGGNTFHGQERRTDPEIASGGRWPANVLLDPEAAALLDEQTGVSISRKGTPRTGVNGNGWGMTETGAEYADKGGASRFFGNFNHQEGELCLCLHDPASGAANCSCQPSRSVDSARADAATSVSPEDSSATVPGPSHQCPASTPPHSDPTPIHGPARGAADPDSTGTTPTTPGLTSLSGSALDVTHGSTENDGTAGVGDLSGCRFLYCPKASSKERNAGLDERNGHPTVKPVELMRWLVRLVTPPGGLVIDPFAGSGTTGIACALEGLNFIGIEREADYVEIARARIAHWGLPS